MIATTTRKYRDVFDPADHGEWELPAAVSEARITLARVTEALSRVVEPPPLQQLKDEVVRATMNVENPLDADLTSLLDHARLRNERDTRVAVLQEAQQRADMQLSAAVYDNCDRIIVQCLRPAGEATWAEISKDARLLGDLDGEDMNGLLRAGAKVRQAWLNLGELAAKYYRVRAAMERLLLHAGDSPQHDIYADHGEFRRGLCTIIGPNWRSAPMAEKRKLSWPTEDRARLVWLARNGHEPWFPTTAERDEAWMAAHHAEHDRAQHQQYRNRVAQRWATAY